MWLFLGRLGGLSGILSGRFTWFSGSHPVCRFLFGRFSEPQKLARKGSHWLQLLGKRWPMSLEDRALFDRHGSEGQSVAISWVSPEKFQAMVLQKRLLRVGVLGEKLKVEENGFCLFFCEGYPFGLGLKAGFKY